MREIAPCAYLLEGIPGGNVYALGFDERCALIDSGMSGAADRIVDQLAGAGFALPDLQAVVLTHAHGDHTGNAAELASRSGAPILAHGDELPYVEGTKSLPSASLLQRVLMGLERRTLSRRSSCGVDTVLEVARR